MLPGQAAQHPPEAPRIVRHPHHQRRLPRCLGQHRDRHRVLVHIHPDVDLRSPLHERVSCSGATVNVACGSEPTVRRQGRPFHMF